MPKFHKAVIFLVLLTTLNTHVFAEELFDTEFDVFYNVGLDGETSTDQNIKITNKQGDVVATNYSLTIKDMNIFAASAEDEDGELDVETIVNDSSITVKAIFNKQVIGVDRSYQWSLYYKTKDIATKVGEIWNIHIPKVEILEATKDYATTLIIPDSFGPKIFMSPKPTNEIVEGNTTKYFFNKESLLEKGITASFGNYQVLNFQLLYHLSNESSFTNSQEIALPPDIKNKQQVYYSSLNPPPDRIYTDDDGNVLAVYSLDPNSRLQIGLTGAVRISGRQIIPEFGGQIGEIPGSLRRKYTKTEKYWEVNSNAIQTIADSLLDKDLTTSQNAQKAYEYVTKNLNYDFDITGKDFVDRNGALKAATDPGPWACMEFTDLFVSIVRAMGIPARELNGYAFATESNLTPLSINLKGGDLLHSWAEYYDPIFGWVQVDPTWGTTSGIDYFTKLDTSHFVFSIKGVSSEYPFPAGAYKVDGTEKQVEVAVSQDPEAIQFNEDFKVYKAFTNWLVSVRDKQKYIVSNESGLRLFNINNSGKDLLPFSTTSVFLPKDSNQISFEDFNGEEKTRNFILESGKAPKKNTSSNASLGLVVFAALLLCGIVYGLIIYPTVLKTLRNRLPRRPRDPDQPPNPS